jgi:hypothetical protein
MTAKSRLVLAGAALLATALPATAQVYYYGPYSPPPVVYVVPQAPQVYVPFGGPPLPVPEAIPAYPMPEAAYPTEPGAYRPDPGVPEVRYYPRQPDYQPEPSYEPGYQPDYQPPGGYAVAPPPFGGPDYSTQPQYQQGAAPRYETPTGAAALQPPGLGAPAPEQPTAPRLQPSLNYARQIEAIGRYEPAKRAAVALSDVFEQANGVRAANAYLVSVAATPARGNTIAAIDRALGITVTDRTTALPGAGTDIGQLPAGNASAAVDRIGAYAAQKALSLAVQDPAARARLVDEAEAILTAHATLSDEDFAAIDGYLGLGSGAVVSSSN